MKRATLLLIVAILGGCASQPAGTGPQADLKAAAKINAQLGVDYMRKGELSLAEEKLKRAVREDPDLSLAYTALGILYSRKGRDDEAEASFKEALSLDSDNPDSLNNYGIYLCSKGKTEKAESLFLKAAKNSDYHQPEVAWTNAGVCLRTEDPDQAEKYFRDALKANPNYPDALAHFASLCYQRADYLRARAFLQRYETIAAPTPNTLWLRAKVETALGDDTSARLYQERLKTQFPEAQIADPGAKANDK